MVRHSLNSIRLAAILTLSLCAFTACGGSKDIPVITPSTEVKIAKSERVVIYEANPRVFASKNSIKAIEARLDNIKALGTDILWLMPIYPQGEKNSVGSPYCVRDYKDVNPNFGTIDDLKSLVKSAHDKKMRVILDWVANHTSWDNPWISGHKDWYTCDSNGNIIHPAGTNWKDVADLNYDSREMRAAMQEAMLFWVKEVGVDGFRCDYTDGVPHDFWKSAIDALRSVKSDLFMLSESNDKSFIEDGFNASYCWNFPDWVEKAFNAGSTKELAGNFSNDNSDVAQGCYRMRYTTNHDRASEKSPIQQYNSEDGALAAFAIAALLSDCTLIYSSQEAGYPAALSFFKDNIIDWSAKSDLITRYEKLMKALEETESLRNGTVKIYETGAAATIWYPADGSHGLMAIVNMSNASLTAKVPMERQEEKFQNAITGESLTLSSTITLSPYQYLILKK